MSLYEACQYIFEMIREFCWDVQDFCRYVYLHFSIEGVIHFFRVRVQSCSCRRSLVRMIGSTLPLKSSGRVYFRVLDLKSAQSHLKDESLSNADLQGLTDAMLSGSSDNSHIKQRCKIIIPSSKIYYQNPSIETLREPESSLSPFLSPRASTPINYYDQCSSFSTTITSSVSHNCNCGSSRNPLDLVAHQEINLLKEELEKLRSQMAAIVLAQEEKNKRETVFTTPVRTTQSAESVVTHTSVTPPPPPPPPPPSLLAVPQQKLSIREQIELNKGKSGAKPPVYRGPVSNFPNMAEILKGMDKVKLRHVDRSPGGTPLRPKVDASQSDDPVALLAAALKKRFQHIHQDSPERDFDENRNGSFSSSPDMIHRHHTKRQLSPRSSPITFPLAEVNV